MMAKLNSRHRGWTTLKVVALACLLSAVPKTADAQGFSGDFAPATWLLIPEQGSIWFDSPANTELHLEGPGLLQVPPTSSAESATYSGPGNSGAPYAGELSFNWSFFSGDAISAQADFTWLDNGGPGGSPLSSGGPGQNASGSVTRSFEAGDVFGFLLSSENPIGKEQFAELVISDFHFTPRAVPDAGSSFSLLALAVGALGWLRVNLRPGLRCNPSTSHGSVARFGNVAAGITFLQATRRERAR